MAESTIAVDRDGGKKPYIPLERGWWRLPLFYLLTLSIVGLELYPFLAISIAFLAYQWRHDRYNFLIMLTILWGGFGFFSVASFSIYNIALLASIVLWFVMRKPTNIKGTLLAKLLNFAFMLIIAMLSVESMKVQFLMMSRYWLILYIIVPFAIFSGHSFDFYVFLQKLMPFALMIGIFYILDAYIISGHILIPNDTGLNNSTFFSPAIHFFSGIVYRIYPTGLFFYSLLFIPLVMNYSLRWWQWCIFIGSLAACQTFTVIIGFAVVYVVFKGSFKQICKWCFVGIIAFVSIYLIDGLLPKVERGESQQSSLRIKSSIDQFIDLYNAVDEEDIAEFGSGRMAQILPKTEIVSRENRELIGLGFLHPSKTTLNQYIINNELYTDVEKSEEVATGVEVTQIQVYITMGWLGVFVVTLFYLYLYFTIRKFPHSYYFLSVLALNFMWGFGGFAGIYVAEGCMTIGISYAAIILSERERLPGFNCQWLKERRKRLF